VSPVTKAGGKVLLVTSAVSSEGKSVTAINLAVVAASMNQRVLLVDANLRRPDMHSILNLSVDGGLVDVLRGHRSAPSAIVGVGIEHLHVLAAGEVPVDPAELLTSPRMLSLIGELRGAYDLVVIDTAATLPVADTLEFVGDADAAVFVVRAGVSRTRDVSEAISRVDRAGGSTAGIVLNEVTSRVKRSDRAYYASTSVNGRRKKSQGGPEQHGVSEGNQIVPGFASDPPEDPEEPATRSA
jgi:capsular exopolysaccharide synthesis family protein